MSVFEKLFGAFDDKLESTFRQKPVDLAKVRAPVLKAIERTKTQWASTEPVKGRKWFTVANNVVAFTPVLSGGHPLLLNGKTTNFIPAERFGDFLTNLTQHVEAGDLDDAITAEGMPTVPVKVRAKREPGNGGSREWSPERREKFAATVAARKAVKEAGQ